MTLNCDFGTNALVTRILYESSRMLIDGFYEVIRSQIDKKNLTKTHNIIPMARPPRSYGFKYTWVSKC